MSKGAEDDRSATPKAIEDCHSLLAWMLPQLDKFPRARRFTLDLWGQVLFLAPDQLNARNKT